MTSSSKTISIGYMHSIIRNVTITNCVIYGSQRGIVIMASEGTGLVEHVLFQNLRIDTKIHAGNWWGFGEPICLVGRFHHYDGYLDPVPDRKWGTNIRDISFRDISCSGENIIGIIGSNDNIDGVFFDNITFEKKESQNAYLKPKGFIDVSPAENNVFVPEDFEDFIYVTDSKNIKVNNARKM